MIEIDEVVRTPTYYIKKRLFANKPAIFGLSVIFFSCLMAILGYLVMPDSTPGANDGAIQIQKKPPIFSTYLLKQKRNIEIESQFFITTML
ncbi:MAG: ABC transporter permease, partial [Cytophagales bacterium]